MRTKTFEITTTAGGSSVFYWPVDTHLYPNFSIGFSQTGGLGQVLSASASFTQFPVLARGTASAGWTQVTTATVGFNVNIQDALTCFRLTTTVSGAGTFGFACNQAGSEYR